MYAGEAMPPDVLRSFSHHVPQASFLNAYGPTETNHCTTALLLPDLIDGKSALPIGLPDAGVVERIADTGELLIASDQLMTGYWNDPERTQEAFVTLPHEGRDLRFYRTGDIVDQDADGTIWLRGRADRQIKLRGFRIELDEVELVLHRHREVREAAVVVDHNAQTLVAFISGTADADTLLRYAAENLPPYAVPERIISVPTLARTSTGKIDRKALLEVSCDRTAA